VGGELGWWGSFPNRGSREEILSEKESCLGKKRLSDLNWREHRGIARPHLSSYQGRAKRAQEKTKKKILFSNDSLQREPTDQKWSREKRNLHRHRNR